MLFSISLLPPEGLKSPEIIAWAQNLHSFNEKKNAHGIKFDPHGRFFYMLSSIPLNLTTVLSLFLFFFILFFF